MRAPSRLLVWSIAAALALPALACRSRADDREDARTAARPSSAAVPPQASIAAASVPAAPADARPRIVVLGDSLTAGLGLPIAAAYPSLLQQRRIRGGDREAQARGQTVAEHDDAWASIGRGRGDGGRGDGCLWWHSRAGRPRGGPGVLAIVGAGPAGEGRQRERCGDRPDEEARRSPHASMLRCRPIMRRFITALALCIPLLLSSASSFSQ